MAKSQQILKDNSNRTQNADNSIDHNKRQLALKHNSQYTHVASSPTEGKILYIFRAGYRLKAAKCA